MLQPLAPGLEQLELWDTAGNHGGCPDRLGRRAAPPGARRVQAQSQRPPGPWLPTPLPPEWCWEAPVSCLCLAPGRASLSDFLGCVGSRPTLGKLAFLTIDDQRVWSQGFSVRALGATGLVHAPALPSPQGCCTGKPSLGQSPAGPVCLTLSTASLSLF